MRYVGRNGSFELCAPAGDVAEVSGGDRDGCGGDTCVRKYKGLNTHLDVLSNA